MLNAVIYDGSRVTRSYSIENPDNETDVADYLYDYLHDKYGEDVTSPVNDIPHYMEASAWCFSGREEGDTYEAEDRDGNIAFTITIVDR